MYVAQLVAPLVSIHVGLPDPCRLSYESASFVWFSINQSIFGCIRVINIVFVSTWWNFSQESSRELNVYNYK